MSGPGAEAEIRRGLTAGLRLQKRSSPVRTETARRRRGKRAGSGRAASRARSRPRPPGSALCARSINSGRGSPFLGCRLTHRMAARLQGHPFSKTGFALTRCWTEPDSNPLGPSPEERKRSGRGSALGPTVVEGPYTGYERNIPPTAACGSFTIRSIKGPANLLLRYVIDQKPRGAQNCLTAAKSRLCRRKSTSQSCRGDDDRRIRGKGGVASSSRFCLRTWHLGRGPREPSRAGPYSLQRDFDTPALMPRARWM
jgi:hypothetical protein